MSNSVVFLLIAVGLSVLGTLAVWLQGKPRRPRSSVDVFNRSLQALATSDTHLEPLSGVTVRPLSNSDDDNYADDNYADDGFADTRYDRYADQMDGDYVSGDYAKIEFAPDEGRVNGNSSPEVDLRPKAKPRRPDTGRRPNPRPSASRRGGSSREGADPGP